MALPEAMPFSESSKQTLNFSLLAPLMMLKLPRHATQSMTFRFLSEWKSAEFARTYLARIADQTYTDENRAYLHNLLLAISIQRTHIPKEKVDEIDTQLTQYLTDVRCFPDHSTLLARLLVTIKMMTNAKDIESDSPDITKARQEILRAIYEHIQATVSGVRLQLDTLFGQDSDPQSTHVQNGVAYALERQFGWGNTTAKDPHATNTPFMAMACTTFAMPYITVDRFAEHLVRYVKENQNETWPLLTYLMGQDKAQEILNKVSEGDFRTSYTNDSGQFQLSVPDAQKLIEKFMRDLQRDTRVPTMVPVTKFEPEECDISAMAKRLITIKETPITQQELTGFLRGCDPNEGFCQLGYNIKHLLVAHMSLKDAERFWKKNFPDSEGQRESDYIDEISYVRIRSSVHPSEESALIYAKTTSMQNRIWVVVNAFEASSHHSKHVLDYLAAIPIPELITQLTADPRLIIRLIVHHPEFLEVLEFTPEQLAGLLKIVVNPETGDTLAHVLASKKPTGIKILSDQLETDAKKALWGSINNYKKSVLSVLFEYNPEIIQELGSNDTQYGLELLQYGGPVLAFYHTKIFLEMLENQSNEDCLKLVFSTLGIFHTILNKEPLKTLELLEKWAPGETGAKLRISDVVSGCCGFYCLAAADPNAFVDYLEAHFDEAIHILEIGEDTAAGSVAHALATAKGAVPAFSRLQELLRPEQREHLYNKGHVSVYTLLAFSNPEVIIAELNERPDRGMRLLQTGTPNRLNVMQKLCLTRKVTDLGRFLKTRSLDDLESLFRKESAQVRHTSLLAHHDIDTFMEVFSRFDRDTQKFFLSAACPQYGTLLETLALYHPKALMKVLDRFKDDTETLLETAFRNHTNMACCLARIHPCELIDFVEKNPELRTQILRTTTREGVAIAHILASTVKGTERYLELLNTLELQEALEALEMAHPPDEFPTLHLAALSTSDYLAQILLKCSESKRIELLRRSHAGFTVAYMLAAQNPKMMLKILATMRPSEIVEFLSLKSPEESGEESLAEKLVECDGDALNGIFSRLSEKELLNILSLSNSRKENVAQKLAKTNPSVCIAQFHRLTTDRKTPTRFKLTLEFSEKVSGCLTYSPTVATFSVAHLLVNNLDTRGDFVTILMRLKKSTWIFGRSPEYKTQSELRRSYGLPIEVKLAETHPRELLDLMKRDSISLCQMNFYTIGSKTMPVYLAELEPERVLALLDTYGSVALKRNLNPHEDSINEFIQMLLDKEPKRTLALLIKARQYKFDAVDISLIFQSCKTIKDIVAHCPDELVTILESCKSEEDARIILRQGSPSLGTLINNINPGIIPRLPKFLLKLFTPTQQKPPPIV